MTDLDKMARELLAAEYVTEGRIVTAQETMDGHDLQTHAEYIALRAIRAALLTASPAYVLVPVGDDDRHRQAAARLGGRACTYEGRGSAPAVSAWPADAGWAPAG